MTFSISAFDALAGEQPSSLGRLATGEDLLKKTGTGKMLTVVGEPDIQMCELPPCNGHGREPMFEVEIAASTARTPRRAPSARPRPTTSLPGPSRATTTRDAFFVRHADFTGADDPYDKLGAPSITRDEMLKVVSG